MKTMLAAFFLLLVSGMVYADNNKRQDCNKAAEGSTGSERTRLISQCIKHNANVNTMPPMLQRMRDCNAQAGEMTGDTREKFMNKCLDIEP
ncbi:MAG: PsiF family protein [Polyangiaceae bacterium]